MSRTSARRRDRVVPGIRTVLFWTHLGAGVIAGVAILVMSFTGTVLALKPQILNWIERDAKYVSASASDRLGLQALLTAVKDARPDSSPTSVTLNRDPETAATVNLGTAGNIYVNPYTGAITGTGSAKANQLFQTMTSWHRYMGATGESRALGKSATGASNIAFLLLALSGLYIWWPKQLSVQHFKPITWFRRTSTGRARDFNWHNVIGFWCLPAIVVMTLSGTVLSYPWASNLVYRLTGSPLPSNGGRGGGAAQVTVVPARLDEVWARAEQQVPTWSLITFRLPNRDGATMSFTITDGAHWNQFARSTLTVNSGTAEVVTWQSYENGSLGQKVRGWLRFAHTGELGRLPGQIIAGIGCLGGVMLVYTGFSLAFRRLWNWSLSSRLLMKSLGQGEAAAFPAPAVLAITNAAKGELFE